MKLNFLARSKDKATDPVCLMKVNIDEKALSYEYDEKVYSERENSGIHAPDEANHKRGRENHGRKAVGIYYFCSENCKGQFKQNPEKYLS